MITDNYILNSEFSIYDIDTTKYKDCKNILIQIFSSQNKQVLKDTAIYIREKIPQAVCVGSTSAGEINNDKIISNSTLISISCFENTSIQAAKSSNESSFKKGLEIASKLNNKDSKLLILFTNASNTNQEDFLNGINKVNSKLTVCGGVASSKDNFGETYTLLNDEIYSNCAVGISLNSTKLNVKTDFKFNWSAIGIEHTITKSKGNTVYEIDNIPIIDFYKKYLGDDIIDFLPQDATTFPILIKKNGNYLARALVEILEDGGFEYTASLKEQEKIKLGFGNEEMILRNPLVETLDKFENAQSFFVYSCKVRKEQLKETISNNEFSNIVNTSGFFTNGEFFSINNKYELFNQTFTIIALNETKESLKAHTFTKEEKKELDSQRKLKKLLHLIKQSSKDYDEQSKKLEFEKINSQMLLTSQKIFLRHAVHETNTPLSVIMSNIELFEMEYGKNPYLTTIEVALKNIFNIYDDLSYLVKKDQVTYPKKSLDIIDFIRSRIEFFRQSAKQIGSEIEFYSDRKSLFLNINETKLQRIIDNNLTNAIKYTEENSNIYITLKQECESYALTISSCSQYIQYPEKIFKEYYREKSTKKGFGLGLSLVKRICDEENIKITIDSNEYFTSFRYLFKVEEK